MFVFGTRPEAIKMAPIISELEKQADKLRPLIVVTGQHKEMLDQVLKIFKIKPHYDLGIMKKGQSLADITANSLRGIEKIVQQEKPDMVLVQGDTSTAFSAGLMAYYHKIPLGHVEAGLRTFDKWRPFPEEINRTFISSLADLHFAPTTTSVNNLLAEKVTRNSIYLTGNSVIDALLTVAQRRFVLSGAGLKIDLTKKLVLVTAHRRESFGKPIVNICKAIARLAKQHKDIEIVIPVHKNPEVRQPIRKLLGKVGNVHLIEPLDYEPFVHLLKASYIILTDSGGVQEEAPSLGKPVLLLREKTERPEAVAFGTVKLVGMNEDLIYREADLLLVSYSAYAKMSKAVNPYGDGRAAGRIVQAICYYFGLAGKKPREFIVKR